MERPWPLAGRDAELRTIAAAVRPGAAGILVAGPAGVGKTRLAREALAHAGRPVLWAHGSTAARPFPLGAFAGVLDVPLGDAAQAVGQALDALGTPAPAVLAVDDAHLLDELSAIVLHRVVLRGLAPVVVTLRSGEAAPDPVTALWKDEHLPRLDLHPLEADVTTALVAQVLGGPVDSRSARRLWALTRGSPLFLRHLLAGEVAAGRFSVASGIWQWADEPALTPELTTLLDREIGAMEAEVRDVLDLVALAEPLAADALVQLTSPAAVEAAEGRALITTSASGEDLVARLAHPLYGEVRRAAMGQVRARRLRGLLARTLEPSADLLTRAVLVVDSDLDPDPALLVAAAQAAIRLYDLPLAERLARAAAATGDASARLVHAASLSWLSRGVEAEAILSDLAEAAPDPQLRAVVQLHRCGNLLWTLGRPAEAERALAAAEAHRRPGEQERAMRSALAASVGDVPAALATGLALLEDQPSDDLALLLLASALSAVAAVTGREELLATAASLGGLDGDRAPVGIPGFGLADWQVLGLRLAGRPDAAARIARTMQTASADLPGPARLMGLVLEGHALLAAGRVVAALVPLREAWAGLAASGHEFRYRCRTLLATATALAGHPDEARPLLEALARDQHPAYRLHDPDDRLARAWGAAADGAVSEGIRLAGSAAELARRQHSPAVEVLAWQVLVQLGGDPPTERLDVLTALGPRAQVTAAHAGAWAAQDALALAEASLSWERLGDLVAAGDAAGQAAVVHRREGRQGSALSAAARAQQLAQQSGARTPALAAAAQPLPLTAREREIAVLAARGLSNRAIAERLTVSVRTVEGHLYRAGQKLGISDRDDLGTILGSG